MTTPAETTTVFADARVLAGDRFTEPQDVIVRSGRVVALAEAGSGAAVAAGDAHSGSEGAGRGPVTRVDLGGAHLMPGFVESHGHPAMYGVAKLRVQLRPGDVGSIDDIVAAIRSAAADRPAGEWVMGEGFDDTTLAEKRMPTRDDLDAAAPDHPVFIRRTCGHMGVANSAALAASGIDESTPDPSGGKLVRDGAGRLTGLLQEDATGLIKPPATTSADLARGFELAQDDFNSWGITTMNDCLVSRGIMRFYQSLRASGGLRVRMRPWLYAIDLSGHEGLLDALTTAGIASGFGDDMLRLQGVKVQLDGSLGGKTAAMCSPFEHSDDTGILTHETAALTEAFGKAARGGLRLAIHAIGDAAIEQAFEAIEASGELDWIKANRTRIEHCSLPTEAQLDTMVDWNLIASSSVGFVYDLGDSYPDVIGEERIKRLLPHRSYIDRGIVAPGNSDLPVTTGKPWYGIYGAVTRKTRTGRVLDTVQNITLAEAIRAYTADAAYANFEEDRAGTIEPGKFADFQVYETSPFDLDVEDLPELRPAQVFLAGEEVHRAG